MAKTKTTPKAEKAEAETPAKSAPAALNSVALIGRLTADPVLRTTASGRSVANFRLAVTNRGATTFQNITCWQQLGELVAKHLSKGRLVAVVGRLDSQSWEQDGAMRSATIVTASQVQFLDRKPEAAA